MILFFDTETTGLPKRRNAPITDSENWPRLVQLAYLVYDFNGNKIHKCCHIIKPDNFTIPIESSKLHRITTDKAIREGKILQAV